MYKLNEKEQKEADDFINNHKCIPNEMWDQKFEYLFSNSGIGECCNVRCIENSFGYYNRDENVKFNRKLVIDV